MFKKILTTIITVMILITSGYFITSITMAAGFGGGGSIFSGGLFSLIGNGLVPKNNRTIGTETNPVAAGYFNILNASTSKITNLSISGSSSGDLNMGGYQITNVATTTATAFVATSTTAINSFLGNLSVGTTTNNSVITIGQSSDTKGIRTYGYGPKSGIYSDLYINTYGNLISSGTYSLMNFKNNLKLDDDKEFVMGGNADFNMVYSNTQNVLQFNVGSVSNSGTIMVLSPAKNVGIGTTSPYAKLSVVGETVSEYFTATSTTAINSFAGDVGIGLTAPTEALEVAGNIRLATPGWLKFSNGTGGDLVQYKGSDGFLTTRDYGNSFTGAKLWSVGDVVTGDTDAVLTLMRSDSAGTNSEFLDLYANGYTSTASKIFGIAIQKRGTGSFRDFAFTTSDGSTVVRQMTIDNTNNRIGIGTSTPQRKLSIDSGASATTTVQIGDIYSGTGKGCVEMPNTTGTVTSFYFVGTTMIIEANACK